MSSAKDASLSEIAEEVRINEDVLKGIKISDQQGVYEDRSNSKRQEENRPTSPVSEMSCFD